MCGRTEKDLERTSIGWGERRRGRISVDKNMGCLLKGRRNGEGRRGGGGWRNVVPSRSSRKERRLGKEGRGEGEKEVRRVSERVRGVNLADKKASGCQ